MRWFVKLTEHDAGLTLSEGESEGRKVGGSILDCSAVLMRVRQGNQGTLKAKLPIGKVPCLLGINLPSSPTFLSPQSLAGSSPWEVQPSCK